MKNLIFIYLLLLCYSCGTDDLIINTPTCQNIEPGAFSTHPQSVQLDEILAAFQAKGIPGISAILYHPDEGLYLGSTGMSNLENKTPLQNCHLFPSASISKMYAAVISLSLYEQGILDINSPISNHLSSELIAKIPNGSTAQIKHLMNHSSGIPEHENSIKLTWDAFHDPGLQRFSDLEYLEYIYNKEALFEAGSKTSYSTSGIIIEDLVLEAITGKPHANLFDELIVDKAGLNNTHFSNSIGYPLIDGRVNMYWDLYSNGNLINSNNLSDGNSGDYQYYLGASKVLFTAYDLFLFIKGIFEDNLFFSNQTLEIMKEIKFEENSTTDGYGFGLEIKVDPLLGIRYGHQGGSIGVNTHVYWYENGGIIVLLSNFAGLGDGPLGDIFDSSVIGDEETLLGKIENVLLQ